MAGDIVLLPFFDIMILVVINVENKLPNRKSTHLKYYDYSNTGVYFVTICIEERKRILSEIIKTSDTAVDEIKNLNSVGELLAAPENERFNPNDFFDVHSSFSSNYKPQLTPIGEIVEEQIMDLAKRYDNVKIKNYVIMPDHIHLLIFLRMEAGAASGSPTLYDVIRAFKSLTSRECKKKFKVEKMFQRSFAEHVIRDREDYDVRMKYIHENPIRWYYKEKE
ncbi:MAG: transposase [Clostridia bacterium]|nr:transposase [Clostridia bacterium]